MASNFTTSTVTPIVVRTGRDSVERYLITDQKDRYWTGSTWTKPGVRKRALLFHTAKKAHLVCHSLLMAMHGHLHHVRIHATFTVQLWTNNRCPLADLQRWISRNTTLVVDTHTHGIGPVAGSYAVTTLAYEHLIEVPPKLFPSAVLCIPTQQPACILCITEDGTSEEPSWCIANQQQHYFQADGDASGKPTCYPSIDEAFKAARGALDVVVPPARTLQAPFYVDLYTPEAVDTTTLRSWLGKAVLAVIKGGNDPTDLLFGAVGMCHFDFASLSAVA
ncbi:MAG: hypothetical protein ACKOEM_13325 [Planctomycetia bacterium]